MIKKYFFAGLLIWLPIMVTLFVIGLLVNVFDRSIALLPAAYRPEAWLGFHLPGFGVLISIIIIFLTGIIATNFFGRTLVKWAEHLLGKVPLVRTVYTATKQVLETMVSSKDDAFRRVLLVEYPRKGLWSIAFQSSKGVAVVENATGRKMVTIFIPTTPNPTSGFLMMIPEDDVIELDIGIEDAMKFVVSLGTVHSLDKLSISSKNC